MASSALADESWWVMGGVMLALLVIMSLLWILCDKCSRRLSNIGYFSILQQHRADPAFKQQASYVRVLPEPPSGSWMCAYKEERLSLCGWTWKSTATYALSFRSKTGDFDGHCVDSNGTHVVLGVYNQWSGDMAWQVGYPWGCVEVKGRYKQEQPGRITGRFVTKVGSQGSLELLALAAGLDTGKDAGAAGSAKQSGEAYLARKSGQPLRLHFRRPDSAEKGCARCLEQMLSVAGRARAERLADAEGRSRREERPIDIRVDLFADRQFNISAPEGSLQESWYSGHAAYATTRDSQEANSDSEPSSDDFKTWRGNLDLKRPSDDSPVQNSGSSLRPPSATTRKPRKASSSNATLVGRSRASTEKAELPRKHSLEATATDPAKSQGIDEMQGASTKKASKRSSKRMQGEDPPPPRSRPRDLERQRGSRERGSTAPARTPSATPSMPSSGPPDLSEEVVAKHRIASPRPAAPSNARHDSSNDAAKRQTPSALPAAPSNSPSDSSVDADVRQRAPSRRPKAKSPDASPRLPSTTSPRAAAQLKPGSRQSARPSTSEKQLGNHKWLEEDEHWPGTPAVWPAMPPPKHVTGRSEDQADNRPRTPSSRSELQPPKIREEVSVAPFPPSRASGRVSQSGSQRVRPVSLRQPTKGDIPLEPDDNVTDFRPPARTSSRRPQSSQAMMV